jgi:hypothetical protein
MTANDAFVIYKRIDDEINACEIPPHRYLGYQLKDERKLAIYQEVVDANVDVYKFFLANCVLNPRFFIDYFKYNRDKSFFLYNIWDELIEKRREPYFRRVMKACKRGIKLNLNDRDDFLELVPVTDPLFFSALYPDILELLLSLDSDWMKFNMPQYACVMDYIRKVIRGYFMMKHMKGFDKLQIGVKKCLVK